ncbi:MAG: chloride channel protein [Terrimicrobiaceae bacterium]
MKGVVRLHSKEFAWILAASGLAYALAVLFASALEHIEQSVWTPLTQQPMGTYLGLSFLLITLGAAGGGWLMRSVDAGAAGSGIPQLKLAYWRDFALVPLRAVVVKFFAGLLCIGGGMSLGKEGPTVFMAGGAASVLATRLGLTAKHRRLLCACGASAGLAAAFNTPLAAVAFVLEEMLENLNSRLMGRLVLASFTAVFLLHWFRGSGALLELPQDVTSNWRSVLLSAPVAVLAGLAGAYFQKASLALRRRLRRFQEKSAFVPVLGAWITWCAGVAVFALTGRGGVFGLGFTDLNAALAGALPLGALALLLGGKWVATVTSYGSGGSGGIFAPSLFMGAMCGGLVGGLLQSSGWLGADGNESLAVVGMGAFLVAVVRAPATSLLIVFELTHDFDIIPPLMIGTLCALRVAKFVCKENFYNQVLADDGHDLARYRPAESFSDWKQRAVTWQANFSPCCLPVGDLGMARQIVESNPWRIYPAIEADGTVVGAVLRDDIAHAGDRLPVRSCAIVPAQSTLHDAQKAMLGTDLDFVVIVDTERRALAILTLHDLLRAQLSAMEE